MKENKEISDIEKEATSSLRTTLSLFFYGLPIYMSGFFFLLATFGSQSTTLLVDRLNALGVRFPVTIAFLVLIETFLFCFLPIIVAKLVLARWVRVFSKQLSKEILIELVDHELKLPSMASRILKSYIEKAQPLLRP